MIATTGPTPRQKDVLSYVRYYQAVHMPSPTVREICAALGLSSSSTVWHHLDDLERKGLIRRARNKSRSIEIVRPL